MLSSDFSSFRQTNLLNFNIIYVHNYICFSEKIKYHMDNRSTNLSYISSFTKGALLYMCLLACIVRLARNSPDT